MPHLHTHAIMHLLCLEKSESIARLHHFLKGNSTSAHLWRLWLVLLAIVTIWLEGFRMAFEATSLMLWVTSYGLDCIFWLDLGLDIYQRYQTRSHVQPFLVVSVFANIPFELVLWPLQMVWLANVGRLNRLARFHHFIYLSQRQERDINARINRFRTLKFCTYLLLVVHLSACLWYMSACHALSGCGGENWLDLKTKEGAMQHSNYLLSVYWAVATMTSTGYGDYHARTAPERIVAILVMFIGQVIFGYVLALVAAMLVSLFLRDELQRPNMIDSVALS